MDSLKCTRTVVSQPETVPKISAISLTISDKHATTMMKRLITLLAWILPAVVLFSIWFPALWKYRVSIVVDASAVERLRVVPPADRLAELARIRISESFGPFADVLPVADAILAGEPIVAQRGVFRVSARFSAQEVLAGPPQIALAMSSLAVPEVMVRAYAKSRDRRYLDAAIEYVRGWAKFERSVVLPPEGLFWNDHAIAARALVLTELWFHYRGTDNMSYDPTFAYQLMELVDRYGQLLNRHVLYTYRSNHGTMQNLVLMVLSLAFPELEHASEWAETGYRRFVEHMQYYIGRDGVISEHSPGYQPFGMDLIAASLRCATLLGKTVPDDLAERFEQAKIYYAQLRRPDGTVPMFGDTDRGPTRSLSSRRLSDGGYGPLEPLETRKPVPVTLHPDGGVLIWWHGLEVWPNGKQLSQLAVTWSNWPSRVHKHADEGSLVLWSAGRQWIGNAGYFPYYDAVGRRMSEGWPGSNAPHLAGEPEDSAREARPLQHVATSRFAFVELERTRPDGFAARRQILRYSDDLWLVVDSFVDTQVREVNTIWTTHPQLSAADGEVAGVFTLSGPGDASSMELAFMGSPGHKVTLHRGSRFPYVGWATLEDQVVTPTPAFLIRQQSDSGWSVIAAMRSERGRPGFTGAPSMEAWSGPERWSLRLETRDGPVAISRNGAELRLSSAIETVEAIAEAVPAPAHRATMEAAYQRVAAASASRWYEDYVPYRFRASYLVLGLVFGQLVVFAAVSRLTPRFSVPLAGLAAVCWIAAGLWLNFVYFA